MDGLVATRDDAIDYDIITVKQLRKDFDEVLQRLDNPDAFNIAVYERGLAADRIREGIMWLGMTLKHLDAQREHPQGSPYPNSYNPTNTIVEPTADGLTM